MTTTRTDLENRTCYVCLSPIPEGAGVYDARLDILVHRGACNAEVARQRRDYDRSTRGRWIPTCDVLRRLRARRPNRDQRIKVVPC